MIPTAFSTETVVVSNDNPNKKHLVVGEMRGTLYIYDLNEDRVLKTNTCVGPYDDVVFHDTTLYILLRKTNVLYIHNAMNDSDTAEQVQLPLSGNDHNMLGAHKSLVFGRTRKHVEGTDVVFPWTFDLRTKQYKSADIGEIVSASINDIIALSESYSGTGD